MLTNLCEGSSTVLAPKSEFKEVLTILRRVLVALWLRSYKYVRMAPAVLLLICYIMILAEIRISGSERCCSSMASNWTTVRVATKWPAKKSSFHSLPFSPSQFSIEGVNIFRSSVVAAGETGSDSKIPCANACIWIFF